MHNNNKKNTHKHQFMVLKKNEKNKNTHKLQFLVLKKNKNKERMMKKKRNLMRQRVVGQVASLNMNR